MLWQRAVRADRVTPAREFRGLTSGGFTCARDVVRQKSLILSCMKSKTCRWKNVTSSCANLQVHRHGTKGQGCIMLHCDEFHKLRNAVLIPCILGQSSFWRVYQRADAFNCHGPRQKCTCQSRGSKGSEKCGLERGMEREGTRIP